MKRLNLITIVTALLMIAACKKQITNEKNESSAEGGQTEKSALACQPAMYQLAVDPATGNSYVNKVSGSPGAGPVIITPYTVGGGTNQLITCAGAPVRFASGLAYDPTTGVFYGTTGASSPTPNHIFRFTNPNCVSTSPALNNCALNNMDLSDVERSPATGAYYAINRSTIASNNRIVRLGLPGAPTVNCLANPLPAGMNPRGLTLDCGGQLYVMHVAGTGGTIAKINNVTGAFMPPAFPYPGPVTPGPGVAIPEMGLHWDCFCINRFITGNYHPIGVAPIMTDGLPAGLGGPIYNAMAGVLRPTVDFARP